MYDVFLIDPPWPKKKGGIYKNRPDHVSRELDYDTMPVPQIFQLLDKEILTKANSPHVVFLWSIDEFLKDGEAHLTTRGYRMHARLIWDKVNGPGPALTVRFTHEYLTWFYKPMFLPIDETTRNIFPTIFTEHSREHSRKPECIYKMIERWYPTEKKLDVFSRQARLGWDAFGNETGKFKG